MNRSEPLGSSAPACEHGSDDSEAPGRCGRQGCQLAVARAGWRARARPLRQAIARHLSPGSICVPAQPAGSPCSCFWLACSVAGGRLQRAAGAGTPCARCSPRLHVRLLLRPGANAARERADSGIHGAPDVDRPVRTMLGESVGWRRWLAVLSGFAGVLIVLRPGTGFLSFPALAVLRRPSVTRASRSPPGTCTPSPAIRSPSTSWRARCAIPEALLAEVSWVPPQGPAWSVRTGWRLFRRRLARHRQWLPTCGAGHTGAARIPDAGRRRDRRLFSLERSPRCLGCRRRRGHHRVGDVRRFS